MNDRRDKFDPGNHASPFFSDPDHVRRMNYVCVKCRFNKKGAHCQICPKCQGEMKCIGERRRVPKKRNNKAWKKFKQTKLLK